MWTTQNQTNKQHLHKTAVVLNNKRQESALTSNCFSNSVSTSFSFWLISSNVALNDDLAMVVSLAITASSKASYTNMYCSCQHTGDVGISYCCQHTGDVGTLYCCQHTGDVGTSYCCQHTGDVGTSYCCQHTGDVGTSYCCQHTGDVGTSYCCQHTGDTDISYRCQHTGDSVNHCFQQSIVHKHVQLLSTHRGYWHFILLSKHRR